MHRSIVFLLVSVGLLAVLAGRNTFCTALSGGPGVNEDVRLLYPGMSMGDTSDCSHNDM